ncbi:hypothetical protein DFJ74DRAFT_675045 [Hyaloraphidium curvatum]|nr:hypothetical protein DFJ74DRAFT_675045 [Hyaloraphidium curvatum]
MARFLALAAAAALAAVPALAQSNITILENGPPTTYTLNSTSAGGWTTLGGATFFGTNNTGGLRLTNNSFNQNGLAFLNSVIPRGVLFGGFDQQFGFLIDENRPTDASQADGVGYLFAVCPFAALSPPFFPEMVALCAIPL